MTFSMYLDFIDVSSEVVRRAVQEENGRPVHRHIIGDFRHRVIVLYVLKSSLPVWWGFQ